jgi:HD-like signal output (HDOD) protein
VLGVSHAEVGAYLLALWDLPHDVVEPVALHHQRAPGYPGGEVASLVALANLLAHEATGWRGVEGERVELDGVPDIERCREVARGEAGAMA